MDLLGIKEQKRITDEAISDLSAHLVCIEALVLSLLRAGPATERALVVDCLNNFLANAGETPSPLHLPSGYGHAFREEISRVLSSYISRANDTVNYLGEQPISN
jgi:hypothetical protein